MIENWNEFIHLIPAYGFRLGVAAFCGLLLGIERERKDKPAGLRTIVLITVGAALFLIVSNLIPFVMDWPEAISRSDPARIAAQVVSGIGFLGAGTIIQARGSVHGLTTAAVIWVAAGIGLCAGLGFPLLAILITILVLATLIVMEPLRTWLSRRGDQRRLTLVVPDDSLVLERVIYVLEGHDVSRESIQTERRSPGELELAFTYQGYQGTALRLLEALSGIDKVRGSSASSEDE